MVRHSSPDDLLVMVLCVFLSFSSRSFMLIYLRKFALPGERGLGDLWPGSTYALKPAHLRLIFHPAASNHPPSWAEVFSGVIGQQSALDCCTKPGSTENSVNVILCQYSDLFQDPCRTCETCKTYVGPPAGEPALSWKVCVPRPYCLFSRLFVEQGGCERTQQRLKQWWNGRCPRPARNCRGFWVLQISTNVLSGTSARSQTVGAFSFWWIGKGTVQKSINGCWYQAGWSLSFFIQETLYPFIPKRISSI